jgi:hypothetical protein
MCHNCQTQTLQLHLKHKKALAVCADNTAGYWPYRLRCVLCISFKTFVATWFSIVFSGLQFCLRMGTELVPETLYWNELTRLCARENYIECVLCLTSSWRFSSHKKLVNSKIFQCIYKDLRNVMRNIMRNIILSYTRVCVSCYKRGSEDRERIGQYVLPCTIIKQNIT